MRRAPVVGLLALLVGCGDKAGDKDGAAVSTRSPPVRAITAAWGRFIDGCTASVKCSWSSCRVMSATGQLKATASTTKTCNMAVRIFSGSGALRYRADYSSGAYGDSACWINRAAANAYYGEWVTVQSNGVIANSVYAAGQVQSYAWLAPA